LRLDPDHEKNVAELPVTVRRPSKLDEFAEQIESWLAKYEDLTAVRLHEMLTAAGFTGQYTIVREYLRRLRKQSSPKQAFLVVETPAGYQAQFDWSPYVLPGCEQKVQLWGCSLSWSRARAFEATAGHGARRRTAKILIDDLDLVKTQIAKAGLHCVLKFTALEVV